MAEPKKRVRKKPVAKPAPNYEVVRDLFQQLKTEMDIDDNCPSHIFDKIKEAEKDFFEPAVRKALAKFQHEIAATLRATAKESRPDLDHQIGFWVWVAESGIPDAMQKMRMLDALEQCPDSFRGTIRQNYAKSGHKYQGT